MSLLDKASLILTPNATKESKLYSIVPSTGNGDMTVVRGTTATRVNSLGLIENVASNVARLNYEGSCPSILLEPQRTNLLTYSEDFSDFSWGKQNSVLFSNVLNSPNNTNTADKLIENTNTSSHYIAKDFTPISGTTYTASIFVKQGERSFAFFGFTGGSMATTFISINLSNGVISNAIGTPISSTSTSYGNGWWKVSLTLASTGATSSSFDFRTSIDGIWANRTYIGDGTSGIYIWGAQLEQGTYPTSYIPTVASTVTRNADVISKTGISDLIGQTEGTIFLDICSLTNGGQFMAISLSDGTINNELAIKYRSNANELWFVGRKNNTDIFVDQKFNITQNVFNKIAIKYSIIDTTVWLNGVKIATKAPMLFTANILNSLLLREGGEVFYGKVNELQLYKTALTDQECINLTTL